MADDHLPFATLTKKILSDLASGRCLSITGLSNSGKSTLMRALASEAAARLYRGITDQPAVFLYVDCNRAVANSAQAFYEVVLRSVLEQLTGQISSSLSLELQEYHRSITEAETAFEASLAFNLALSELCEKSEWELRLLLDEFDEIYVALDERALLNLRALRDRFGDRLSYITATVHPLPQLRGEEIEDEFAELFSRFSYAILLLEPEDLDYLFDQLNLQSLTSKRRKMSRDLSGDHPGLLIAAAQVLARLPKEWEGDPLRVILQDPQPGAECLKIWSQLDDDVHANLLVSVPDTKSGLSERRLRHLEALGLIREGEMFSPIFADFVARKGRGVVIESQGVHVDSDSGDVWVDGVRIPVLTDLEFRLLELLYTRKDKLTDKYRIVTAVWGEEYLGEVDDARVEKLVSRLRGKIESDPTHPRYLITRRGRGYKLLSKPSSVE